jgi:GNAT superfamily N-acetyltransferase
MIPLRIEEAALRSWPALREELYDGWLLRLARGYTKRANSVNPAYPSSIGLEEKVETCERFYAREDQPCIFRMTPFSHPVELDRFLEERDYRKMGTTLVLYRHLQDWRPNTAAAVDLSEADLDEWMAAFRSFTGSSDEEQDVHRTILSMIGGRRMLGSLIDSGRPVACGVGVIDDGYLGLFDIVTDPQQRGRGYGTTLIAGLLGWAQESGGRHAYLQVVESNEPALRTYAKFGFEEVYRYWYRASRCPEAAAPESSAAEGG